MTTPIKSEADTPVRGEAISPARLEALSDGVLAIAATLLIIEVHAPESGEPVWASLLESWPALAAYAVSFLVIGIVWVNHHTLFRRVAHANRALLFMNLGLLATIAFLPLPTATIGTHLTGGQAVPAAIFYSLTMMASASWFTVLWGYLARHPHLMHPEARHEAQPAVVRSLMGPLLFGTAALVALVSPVVSLLVCASASAYFVVGHERWAARWHRRKRR
ncbi:TMEM175 family protein [Glycomyces artemisiae]|uniref:Putative membrane protein n=1 Tax=Glycomyces artemisiae TaxID=1076443 RepID=A0A2T0USX0_9ACTN|nr:TMEM175 family protein [Glycomyces artemisiae]PRY60948.1 putative membrane protein [Glycomyces artemisiae]